MGPVKKQTAVEWLISEIQRIPIKHRLEKKHLYYHALKIEKEQIQKAFDDGNCISDYYDGCEQYYNKIYGGDK